LPGALARSGILAKVFNAGIGDTTTRDAVARLDRDVLRRHPDLVIVQFGINDSWIDVDQGQIKPRLTRAEYRDNLRVIARRTRARGARVLFMTPNPMRWKDRFYIQAFREHPGLLDVEDPRGLDKLLDLYAQDVRDVAAGESIPVLDVFRAFEDYGRVPGQSVEQLLLASDGIHPNQQGQSLVCSLLATRIAGLVKPH
jgi:lysophospholipase L1-like esterase